MIIVYLILSLLAAGAVMLPKGRTGVKIVSMAFCALQAGMAAYVILRDWGGSGWLFRFDPLGTLFFTIMAVIAPLVVWSGWNYLRDESLRHFKYYHLFLLLLCTAVSGLYFADNLAVTWIFAEATTLCTAGLVYHRRGARSLEATWKYLFVCSVGIAIAYLGILLLSTAGVDGGFTYAALTARIAQGNPLYMKIAFLFIFVGYSCKMEVFPLYTVGVDANSAAPSPASVLISTALVNGGFLAIYRVVKIFEQSPVYPWTGGVMIVAGIASVLLGTLFMRRTNNYKRLLAYSTVENMGIVLIGLGIGGVGVFAALLHLTAHSLIKSGLFLQVARIGSGYGTYRINRIGGLMAADPLGAVTMIILAVLLLAFPPSPLFFSEVLVFSGAITGGRWWIVAVLVLLVCIVIYNFFTRVLRLCYKPAAAQWNPVGGPAVRWVPLALGVLAICLGVWQGGVFVEFLNAIVR
ncbi:MAG: hydrogenase 4 subunit F [Rikenellaceae bacterium]|jgi:hydrogenase-4 component F|nr:hydrogenase 4 subunit F [Rikenellaceae bacterium]